METPLAPDKLDGLIELFSDSDYCKQNPYVFDEYFCDSADHPYLKQVWDRRAPLKDIHSQTFPRFHLVDVMNKTDYFVVCRAIGEDGNVACLKFPLYRIVDKQYWDAADAAIVNETQILKLLQRTAKPEKAFPELVGSGQVELSRERKIPYLATAYIPGLQSVSDWKASSLHDLLVTFLKICQAVDVMHRRRMVHGDLPGNVFLDRHGQVVILDFAATSDRRWWGDKLPRIFGPRVSDPIDEARYPSRAITPAFDVYCLATMLQRKLAIMKVHNKDDTSHSLKQNKLDRLLNYCVIPKPEYRLRSAGKLVEALKCIMRGEEFEWSPSLADHATYYGRRYPGRVTTCAALFVLLIVLCSGSFFYGLSMAAGAREVQRAYRDGNESRLKLIRISVQQERDSRSVRHRDARKQLFLELKNVLGSHRIPEDMLISTLDLCLELALAHDEIDGFADTAEVAQACLDVLDQRQFTVSAYQIRRIQFQVVAARGYIGLNNKPEMRDKAKDLTATAANDFLTLTQDWDDQSSDWTLQELLYTGHLITENVLYPQRNEKWMRAQHGRLARQVFDRLEILASADRLLSPDRLLSFEEQLFRCQIQTTLGRSIYKGLFKGEEKFESRNDLAEQRLSEALLQLQLLANEASSPSLQRQIAMETARTQIALAQVYQNMQNYSQAIPLGQAAVEYYREELAEAPGSLLAVRNYINACWIYADIFYDRPQRGWPRESDIDQYKLAVELREEVLELCRFQLERETNLESIEDYVVNALRTAISYLWLDDLDNAERVLRNMEQLTGIVQPSEQHGSGEEMLTCLLFLASRSPTTSGYEERIEVLLDKLLIFHNAIVDRTNFQNIYQYTLEIHSRDALRPRQESEAYNDWINFLKTQLNVQ